ncbi:PQQ-binding-like beta-propeller repeat protein [Methanocella sp. MCL-LM]|uniref:outer membrane protein assembly factor BamB family protein n=1 Tax=Methanocella sp. MCL-LM TaxID=3412035 RepID=UPI003C738204
MRKALAILLVITLLALMPAQAIAGDWTAVRKDARHTSYTTDTLAPPLEPAWVNNAGNGVIGSAVISGNNVYYANGAGNSLIAADLATGKVQWIFPAGGSIENTPALVNDTLIFGSYDGNVYRVRTSDGSLVWKSQVGDGMYSSPLVYENRVFTGTDGSNFYALDLATGKVVWKLERNTTQASPAGDQGKVFIGMHDGQVYALDAATGNIDWSYDTASQIHASPMIFDGKVFIATRGGELFAFDESSGALLWKANLGYKADATPSADPGQGTVIVGTYGGYAKSFYANNGTLKWVSGYYGPIYSTLTVSGDAIYGVTQDGWMFALDREDGSGLWGIDVGGGAFASPVVANEYLVIGTLSSQVIAFKASAVAATPAPGASSPAQPDTSVLTSAMPANQPATPVQTPFPGALAAVSMLFMAFILARRR